MYMDNIVTDWLRVINLGQYSESFIDNGYDHLETVKLIHTEDLEAIGVVRADHQERLLHQVRLLKEQGAAWVYLTACQHPHTAVMRRRQREEKEVRSIYRQIRHWVCHHHHSHRANPSFCGAEVSCLHRMNMTGPSLKVCNGFVSNRIFYDF